MNKNKTIDNNDFTYYSFDNLLYKKTHQLKLHHKRVDPQDIFNNLKSYNLNGDQIDTLIDEVKEWNISERKKIAAILISVVSMAMSFLVAMNDMPEWCAWFVGIGILIAISIDMLYRSSQDSTALAALQAYKRSLLDKTDTKN